jgi:CelD/BcsL family acetyltransferase involved in cellulose biosynthesis
MLNLSKLSAFDFLSAEYRDLYDRSDATAFQHPAWLSQLYTRLADPAGATPAIVTGRLVEDGRLVLVMPMVERRYGPFMLVDAADFGVTDYNAIVVDRAFREQLAREKIILQRQVRKLWGALALVRIRKIRPGTLPDINLVLPPQRAGGMGYAAYAVAISTPFSAWRQENLGTSFGRSLAVKRRRLNRLGQLAFVDLQETDPIRRAFAAMREFRVDRWGRDDILTKQHAFDFYLDLASAGVGERSARTYALMLNDDPIAVLFGLVRRDRFLFLLLGFDRRNFGRHSPGGLMLESAIEHCINQGLKVFDFTIGDEVYKGDFGAQPESMLVAWGGNPFLAGIARGTFAQVVKRRLVRAGRAAHARTMSPQSSH